MPIINKALDSFYFEDFIGQEYDKFDRFFIYQQLVLRNI